MINPVRHIPAHKQTDQTKQPGQIVNPPCNVWVQAVKQDKEQAK